MWPRDEGDRVGSEPQPRSSPGSWVVKNRIVLSQAILAAPALYASGRSFSKNQCVVPEYVWNVTSFPRVQELLETLHRSGGFKLVGLGKVTEEGRLCLRQLCLIVVALSSPVEEDDCTQILRELLGQPKRPERSEGQPNDTEPLSPHRRMALEASHAPDNVPAGSFVVEFREQLLRLLPR